MNVPASGPKNARIAVVGMAPADEEVRLGYPFAGPSGSILNHALQRNNYRREDVFVTNVVDFPLKRGGSIFDVGKVVLDQQKERLKGELEAVRPNVTLVLGDEPLQVLVGLHGIRKWRGSIVPSVLTGGGKCVASVHPAWITRGMDKWIHIFTYIDVARAVEESSTPDFNLPKREALIAPSLDHALEYIKYCSQQEYLSFDIETFGDEITCVGIGTSADEAMSIPLTRSSVSKPYWSEEDESLVWSGLASLLESPIKKIGQNLSFEWIYFWRHHIFPRGFYIDTMLLHHCLYPDFGGEEDYLNPKKTFDEPGHSLAFINSQYTRTPYYKEDRKIWKSGGLSEHSLWEYNCKDVSVTFEAAFKMREEAVKKGLWEYYCSRYQRQFYHALRMEWYGIKVDNVQRKELGKTLEKELSDKQKVLNDRLGYPLNVFSSPQMKEFLYQKKGYPVKRDRKSGAVTANAATIQYFSGKFSDPDLKLILEIRKLRDTISDGIEIELDSNERIHSHYKLGGTDGTRWSSGKSILGGGTNLQNVARAERIRKLYLAD